MLNRCLTLLVAIVAPISAIAMLFAGARPLGAVSLAERMPSVALAIVALTLAALHLRKLPRQAPNLTARGEAAMWFGMSLFLSVAAVASPHLSLLGIVGTLLLAVTSAMRLVARHGAAEALAQAAIRRRRFA